MKNIVISDCLFQPVLSTRSSPRADINKENLSATSNQKILKPVHKKTQSFQFIPDSPPTVSFESSLIPSLQLDLVKLINESKHLSTLRTKAIHAESRASQREWSSAKHKIALTSQRDLTTHTVTSTIERLKFNQMLAEEAKEKRVRERAEKSQDFCEFVKAKKSVKAEEKIKEAERLVIEKEKSESKRKERECERERIVRERREKSHELKENLRNKREVKMREKDERNREREERYKAEILSVMNSL